MEKEIFERVELPKESLQIIKDESTGKDKYFVFKPVETITVNCIYDLWVNRTERDKQVVSKLGSIYGFIPEAEYEESYRFGDFQLEMKLEELIPFMALFQQLDFREKDYAFRVNEDGKNINIVEVELW